MSGRSRRLREEKAAKARRKRKSRRKRRVLFLMGEIFILSILLGIGYVMAKYDKFQITSFNKGDIKVNAGTEQEGYTTLALFGGDSRDGALEEGTHADCIIIVSIDNKTKNIQMVSVYRDTLTEQMDGDLKKANNSYFTGGPKDAINMLNKNLDLAIQNYVTVDFKALADTIDLLGGVEIDIKEEEIQYINEFLEETAQVAGKDANFVNESGNQLLDGSQAVTYARIRSTAGGDYTRTERQRLVLEKIFEKVLNTKISTLNKIIDKVFPQVSTSFSLKDMIGLAAGVTQYSLGETAGFPFERTDGNVDPVGSIVIPLGVVENVQELHAFLYPEDSYEVSETVKKIAGSVENFTGYTRADYKDPEQGAENDE